MLLLNCALKLVEEIILNVRIVSKYHFIILYPLTNGASLQSILECVIFSM